MEKVPTAVDYDNETDEGEEDKVEKREGESDIEKDVDSDHEDGMNYQGLFYGERGSGEPQRQGTREREGNHETFAHYQALREIEQQGTISKSEYVEYLLLQIADGMTVNLDIEGDEKANDNLSTTKPSSCTTPTSTARRGW
ncbi:hypothetical protein ILUMI_24593 [Ignelater luminosus]|uniref:Uncharacterized protein n=1 Tax=Ignelater luminosus TaxID=2038154 RepID=A0A8K0FWJ0_IGNLU|nr:hypothetical protein ILUMI_24593 [Ignelater luminosus]